ncbi:hypothetical protein PHYSODRAFT_502225 [Phytophthora sojae]|uniref:DDE-1 domain-containing protein n=1 Tax=Phytophthora sojae (strain P6497) TaxID=1094619 RepID=G4ZCE5_PHYSP|nr:hypothetical protein PHYSODRAFT_502225 [Phytophthora sojae]EGZ16438.1 hypothetical protein PHYSODRAFT_502225 [Phytophthora sojae]|eukprot:XP_009525496.1 hypothetical protein PHYSODRAFT_502225 [Phytophthora sojae]
MEKHEETQGVKDMFAKAVAGFPTIFNSATASANLAKAIDWWAKKDLILGAERGVISGRGRPRSAWVTWLYSKLLDEFDRLHKLGVKFEPPLLLQLAKQILRDGEGEYTHMSVDAKQTLIIEKINSRWIQCFMEAHQIVLRTQTGKRQLSQPKILHIEKEVAFHLGELQRGFADGSLDENAIENIDETHFVIDFDTGKTLGFSGEQQTKYADVVSGGEGMTMVVRLLGGASARPPPSPMMIFMNAEGKHPIRGVPDYTPGVCYRSSKKGWMTQRLFRNYLSERKAMRADPHDRNKTIYLDNCSKPTNVKMNSTQSMQISSSSLQMPPTCASQQIPSSLRR